MTRIDALFTPKNDAINYEKTIRHALRSAKQQTLKIMSINRNRAATKRAHNNKEHKIIELFGDRYFEDYYPRHSNVRNRHSKKFWGGVYHFQYRMYRTWKYNRKTQWKV